MMGFLLGTILGAAAGRPPGSDDLARFPTHEVAVANRRFADEYVEYLSHQCADPDLQSALLWAQWHRELWNTLESAHVMRGDPSWYRHHMAVLQRQLGSACYDQGIMPLPVPLTSFRLLSGPLVEGR